MRQAEAEGFNDSESKGFTSIQIDSAEPNRSDNLMDPNPSDCQWPPGHCRGNRFDTKTKGFGELEPAEAKRRPKARVS